MSMDLTPEQIETATFTTRMRGYDPEEVDTLLAEVAAELRAAKQQAERSYEALGEQMGDLLQLAKDRADNMTSTSEADANQTRAKAEADANKMRAEAEADAKMMRDEATSDAARMRAEAEKDAKKVRDDAAADAARTRSEADHDATDMVARAEARVIDVEDAEIKIRARLADLRDELTEVTKRTGVLAETEVIRSVPATGTTGVTVTAETPGPDDLAETEEVDLGEVPEHSIG